MESSLVSATQVEVAGGSQLGLSSLKTQLQEVQVEWTKTSQAILGGQVQTLGGTEIGGRSEGESGLHHGQRDHLGQPLCGESSFPINISLQSPLFIQRSLPQEIPPSSHSSLFAILLLLLPSQPIRGHLIHRYGDHQKQHCPRRRAAIPGPVRRQDGLSGRRAVGH